MSTDRRIRALRSSQHPWKVLDVLRSMAVVLAAVIALAVWGWLRNADSRALASMDPDLRRELFQRSRAEAEVLCTRPELSDECRTRVEFLARFPECDASCRELVARQLRRPSR